MEALRSSVWSSETLLEGMNHVASQPGDFLAKAENEPDQELVDEIHAPFTWIQLKFSDSNIKTHIYIYIYL